MKIAFTVLSAVGLVSAAGYNVNASSSATSSVARVSATSNPLSATATVASPSATPVAIPSSISSTCASFLMALNSASGMQTCLSPLVTALTSSKSPSISSVCSTVSTGCPNSLVRTWLANFKGNCTDELVMNPNKQILAIYEHLYLVKPFAAAVCAQDEAGAYCISKLAGNSSAKAASGMANAAQTPLTSADGSPNAEAFNQLHVMWLGANPAMSAPALCTTCTKKVLASYFQWEAETPMAYPLIQSTFLSSQADMWTAVEKTCPANFLSGALSNAGASPGNANGAITSSPVKGAMAILAIVTASALAL